MVGTIVTTTGCTVTQVTGITARITGAMATLRGRGIAAMVVTLPSAITARPGRASASVEADTAAGKQRKPAAMRAFLYKRLQEAYSVASIGLGVSLPTIGG